MPYKKIKKTVVRCMILRGLGGLSQGKKEKENGKGTKMIS
jgi:hypothetical protein